MEIMAALKKIAMIEAFGVMNESHHKQYEDKKNEIESLGYDLTGWSTVFFLNETRREILCKFVDAERLVRYSIMFQLSNVGRPSMGTTKKVSITLPDKTWEKIDEEEKTRSAFFRKSTEDYFANDKNQDEIVVEIAEMVMGYWQVLINNLPIANYKDLEEADKLVKHFIKINSDKNIRVID
jgi:hypothetical protein